MTVWVWSQLTAGQVHPNLHACTPGQSERRHLGHNVDECFRRSSRHVERRTIRRDGW